MLSGLTTAGLGLGACRAPPVVQQEYDISENSGHGAVNHVLCNVTGVCEPCSQSEKVGGPTRYVTLLSLKVVL